jgi:small-conductance mechanosensitive channel
MKNRYKIFCVIPGVFSFSIGNAQTIDSVLTDSTKIVNDSVSIASSLVNEVSTKTQNLSDYFNFSNIIISLILVGATYFFMRVIAFVLSIWAERNTKHRITIKGLIPIIRIIAWIGTLSFILIAVFQPPMASLLAFSASIGVAVGFAAQDLLKNIFGGIIILTDKPFQIGDKVQIGSFYGEVTGIGLRSTRITTADDNLITVPNSDVMSQSVSNANAGEENCQVVTQLYLPLTVNIQEVKKVALQAAQVSKFIYLNKPIAVLFFQEAMGHRVMLKVKVKAYVNDIRNEFAFMSEITEVLTESFAMYYNDDSKMNHFVE